MTLDRFGQTIVLGDDLVVVGPEVFDNLAGKVVLIAHGQPITVDAARVIKASTLTTATALATALAGYLVNSPATNTRNRIYAAGDYRCLELLAQPGETAIEDLFRALNPALVKQCWIDAAGELHALATASASTGVLIRGGIGSLVQAYDAQLAAIAALAPAADQVAYFTALTTAALMTVTAAARTVLDDTTPAAMVDTLGGASSTGSGGLARATSPTLVTPLLGTPTSGVLTNCTGTAAGLTAGNVTTNANLTGPVTSVGNATTIADAELAAIAGLTSAADKIPYFTGSGTAAVTDYTATARVVDASTSINNLRQRIGLWRIFDDFERGLAASGLSSSLGGSGLGVIASHGSYAHHQTSDVQGILQVATGSGSAATDIGCVYASSGPGLYLSDGAEFVFRISTNSATSYKARFGLRSDSPTTSADVVNGGYYEVDTTVSANWYGCTAAASARTKTSTGYALSSTNATWQWFKITFVSTGTGIKFSHWSGTAWVDDLTIATNIPTSGANRQARFFMQIIGNGGTFRNLDCDCFGVPVPSAPPNWT